MGSRHSLVLGVSVSALVLSGCVEGGSRPETAATASAERPAATRLVERDVEAPDVFNKTEAGLWDGRPSLGGVWVAHPDVTDPERVLIRNRANGETVIGALFRRERTMPGPRFQVSSDAAGALGMLAGAPVELDVTALRREEAPAPQPAEEAAPAVAADATEPESGAEAPAVAAAPAASDAADPIESAASAIERAETAQTEEAPAANARAAADDAGEARTSTGRSREGGGFFANLFRRSPGEPLSAIPAGTTSGVSLGGATTPEITAEPLDPQPAAARAPQGGGPGQPFVQIGIFSVEANAEATAEQMRRQGVDATIYEQESAGTTFWRVVAGPADTRGDRAALLRKVKQLGYADAYAVAR
jgi:hypothetical protein